MGDRRCNSHALAIMLPLLQRCIKVALMIYFQQPVRFTTVYLRDQRRGLALQLHFSLEVSTARLGLVSAWPE